MKHECKDEDLKKSGGPDYPNSCYLYRLFEITPGVFEVECVDCGAKVMTVQKVKS